MPELAHTQFEEIRQLALDPTPANFRAIEAKLETLAFNLSAILANPESVSSEEAGTTRRFLQQLPEATTRLQNLMHAPLAFYQTLDQLRAAHFGSYERSGGMRGLEAKPSSTTVVHL